MRRANADGQSAVKYHDWRKRVKCLWHYTEFFQPLWPAIFEATANEFHLLSDYLGDAHDIAVLADYLEQNKNLFGDDPELADLIAILSTRRRESEQNACPLGLRLYAEQPNAFASRIAAYWSVWRT